MGPQRWVLVLALVVASIVLAGGEHARNRPGHRRRMETDGHHTMMEGRLVAAMRAAQVRARAKKNKDQGHVEKKHGMERLSERMRTAPHRRMDWKGEPPPSSAGQCVDGVITLLPWPGSDPGMLDTCPTNCASFVAKGMCYNGSDCDIMSTGSEVCCACAGKVRPDCDNVPEQCLQCVPFAYCMDPDTADADCALAPPFCAECAQYAACPPPSEYYMYVDGWG